MLPSSLLTVYLFCEMAVHLRLLVFMKGYDIFFHTVPLVFFLKQSREKTSRRQNKQFVVNLFKMYLSLVCLASNHIGNFRVKKCQHACMHENLLQVRADNQQASLWQQTGSWAQPCNRYMLLARVKTWIEGYWSSSFFHWYGTTQRCGPIQRNKNRHRIHLY